MKSTPRVQSCRENGKPCPEGSRQASIPYPAFIRAMTPMFDMQTLPHNRRHPDVDRSVDRPWTGCRSRHAPNAACTGNALDNFSKSTARAVENVTMIAWMKL